jgi:hypothetical protein
VFGHHTAALEGTSAAPFDNESLAEDTGGLPPHPVGLPDRLRKKGSPIGGDVRVNARGVVVERRFDIDDGRERRVSTSIRAAASSAW